MSARALPSRADARAPVAGEPAAEHLRNALALLDVAGDVVDGGRRYALEDIAAMRWRIRQALEQLEPARPAAMEALKRAIVDGLLAKAANAGRAE